LTKQRRIEFCCIPDGLCYTCAISIILKFDEDALASLPFGPGERFKQAIGIEPEMDFPFVILRGIHPCDQECVVFTLGIL